jgi:serine/threonine protein kinase
MNSKLTKILGSGLYGTTYLVKENNMTYALKIQKILKKHIKKDTKYELWREIELYNYINTLNNKDQSFFTKLYNYKIINECTHNQKKKYDLSKTDDWYDIQKSDYCVKFLLEYKGTTTLCDYLLHNSCSTKGIYMFALQILKIIQILNKKGYIHGDLHLENLMIQKTNHKHFMLNNFKIPYNGFQLSVIDYGSVYNINFNQSNKDRIDGLKMLKDLKLTKNVDVFSSLWHLFLNEYKYDYFCKKNNVKLPRERSGFDMDVSLIENIIKNQPKFWNNMTKNILNKNDVLNLQIIENNPNKLNDHYDDTIYTVLIEILDIFHVLHPKLYAKYTGHCSYHYVSIPKEDYFQYIKIKTIRELVPFLYNKI